jgi:hypothetical protein
MSLVHFVPEPTSILGICCRHGLHLACQFPGCACSWPGHLGKPHRVPADAEVDPRVFPE